MSEMIERVARKIATALGDDFDHAFKTKAEWIAARGEKGGRYRDINEPRQADYLEAARDALEGFKDLTPAMTEAGANALRGPVGGSAYDAARDCHLAMIDEALKD